MHIQVYKRYYAEILKFSTIFLIIYSYRVYIIYSIRVYNYRDFSRFSEERPLPHVVDFGSVTLCVVCHAALRFRSARKRASHQFSGPKNLHRPGPWVDFPNSTIGSCGPIRDLDDPLVDVALRTRILADPGGSKSLISLIWEGRNH